MWSDPIPWWHLVMTWFWLPGWFLSLDTRIVGKIGLRKLNHTNDSSDTQRFKIVRHLFEYKDLYKSKKRKTYTTSINRKKLYSFYCVFTNLVLYFQGKMERRVTGRVFMDLSYQITNRIWGIYEWIRTSVYVFVKSEDIFTLVLYIYK